MKKIQKCISGCFVYYPFWYVDCNNALSFFLFFFQTLFNVSCKIINVRRCLTMWEKMVCRLFPILFLWVAEFLIYCNNHLLYSILLLKYIYKIFHKTVFYEIFYIQSTIMINFKNMIVITNILLFSEALLNYFITLTKFP